MLPGGADVLIQEQTKLPDATIQQMRVLGKHALECRTSCFG